MRSRRTLAPGPSLYNQWARLDRPLAVFRGFILAPESKSRGRTPVVLRVLRCVAPCFLTLTLAACDHASAPTEPGVCWRAAESAGRPAFTVLSRDVANLESCAAQLEAIHLQQKASMAGAFQGYFIFVDDAQIASSTGLKSFRYPIFQPAQRAEIDGDLRSLIKDRNGALPSASDIDVERR